MAVAPRPRARGGAQFLLSVSHELKTPLTAIRGYAEGLAEGALPADEAAETIVARIGAARTARRRPARSRAHAESGVQRPARAGRPRRDRARGDARYEAQARDVRRLAPGRGDGAGRRSATPIACSRSCRTSSRTRSGSRLPEAGCASSRRPARSRGDDRARALTRRAPARLRALLPLLALRPRAPGRHGPRARDRQGARRGHGRLRRRREPAGPLRSSGSGCRSRPRPERRTPANSPARSPWFSGRTPFQTRRRAPAPAAAGVAGAGAPGRWPACRPCRG